MRNELPGFWYVKPTQQVALNAYQAQEIDALQRLLLAILKKDKNQARLRHLRAVAAAFPSHTVSSEPHRRDVQVIRDRIREISPTAATYPQWGDQ